MIRTLKGHCQDGTSSMLARLAEDALGADGSKFGEVTQDIEHRLLVEGLYFTIYNQDICKMQENGKFQKNQENSEKTLE